MDFLISFIYPHRRSSITCIFYVFLHSVLACIILMFFNDHNAISLVFEDSIFNACLLFRLAADIHM